MNWVTFGSVTGAVFAGIAALSALVALWYTRSQLRDARNLLADRRLDEKVNALIGGRVLDLMALTEQVRTAVSAAQASAATAQALSERARDSMALLETSQQSIVALQQQVSRDMEESSRRIAQEVAEAMRLRDELRTTAAQAESDARAISEAAQSIDLRADCVDVIAKLREEGVLSGPNPFAWIPLQLPDEPAHETIASLFASLGNRFDGDDDDVEDLFIVTNRATYPGEEGTVPDNITLCPIFEFENCIRSIMQEPSPHPSAREGLHPPAPSPNR